MLNILDINIITNFIKSSQGRLVKTGDGFYQTFCPYCNDSSRINSPTHGHGNVQIQNMYYKCWRCEECKSLLNFLIDLGFQNQQILSELKKDIRSKFIMNSIKEIPEKRKIIISEIYKTFKMKHPNEFNKFLEYINYRCLDIDPITFGFIPLIKNNELLIEFYNSNNIPVTARFINNNEKRYIKYPNSDYYFFQNIDNILRYNELTFSEGIFDIVNLSLYYPEFKNSFFFAMNNRNYSSFLKNIISRFLLIGKININIVFDKDITNSNIIINKFFLIKNKLNPEIKLNFYNPKEKDVSQLMLIEKMEI